jgi:hypothetical protein
MLNKRLLLPANCSSHDERRYALNDLKRFGTQCVPPFDTATPQVISDFARAAL